MEYVVQDPAINRSNYLLGRPFTKRCINHYTNSHQILLVGEGDFSFSLALANAFGSAENMVSTSLDSREKVLQLYESAHTTLSNLEGLGATILHGVDVTTMEKHDIIRRMKFHRIVYNFPHAGFYGKEVDKKVIEKHRHLLKMFFKNARTMLSEIGQIHVTHKAFGPYLKWGLVEQAEECGLLLKGCVRFRITDYPGYINRRGAGSIAGESFFLGKCRTYKFVLGEEFLYEGGSPATQVISPNVPWEPEPEGQMRTADEMVFLWEPEPEGQMSMSDEMTVLWEPESERKMRMACEMAKVEEINKGNEFARARNEAINLKGDAVKKKKTSKETSFEEAILELESKRQTRLAAETEKADLERQRDWVLRQLEEACRDKTNIAKRLDEVLRSNEVAVKQKDTILKEAMSEIEFERQARKTAEAAKTDLETAFNHVMVSLNTELKNIHELKRQRDEALYLKEKARREKSIIEEQLDEALRLEENAVGQRDKSLRQQKGPGAQKNINSYVTVMSSGLVFALYLFHKCRAK